MLQHGWGDGFCGSCRKQWHHIIYCGADKKWKAHTSYMDSYFVAQKSGAQCEMAMILWRNWQGDAMGTSS